MLLKLNAPAMALVAVLFCCCSSAYAQTAADLTSADRAAIWRSLGKRATRASEPAGLHVGEAIPDTMHVLGFARGLRKQVPAIRRYSYALQHGQVLIVDRRAKKIVSIVSE